MQIELPNKPDNLLATRLLSTSLAKRITASVHTHHTLKKDLKNFICNLFYEYFLNLSFYSLFGAYFDADVNIKSRDRIQTFCILCFNRSLSITPAKLAT